MATEVKTQIENISIIERLRTTLLKSPFPGVLQMIATSSRPLWHKDPSELETTRNSRHRTSFLAIHLAAPGGWPSVPPGREGQPAPLETVTEPGCQTD